MTKRAPIRYQPVSKLPIGVGRPPLPVAVEEAPTQATPPADAVQPVTQAKSLDALTQALTIAALETPEPRPEPQILKVLANEAAPGGTLVLQIDGKLYITEISKITDMTGETR